MARISARLEQVTKRVNSKAAAFRSRDEITVIERRIPGPEDLERWQDCRIDTRDEDVLVFHGERKAENDCQ
jgi:hypothetical protein